MIIEANIPALIEYLENNIDITDITGNRIFHGTPVNIPDGVYLTLSIRKDLQKDLISNPVIRFRALGNTDEVTLNELYELKSKVVNALVKTDSRQVIDTWEWFTKTSTSFTERIDSNRPMLEFWVNGFLVRDVE